MWEEHETLGLSEGNSVLLRLVWVVKSVLRREKVSLEAGF